MPDPAFWVLVTTMIASVILVMWHPDRRLAMLQAVLTGFVVVAFVGIAEMAAWHMKAHESVQQSWGREISGVAFWGVLVAWILFTIYHASVIVWRKLHPKADL